MACFSGGLSATNAVLSLLPRDSSSPSPSFSTLVSGWSDLILARELVDFDDRWVGRLESCVENDWVEDAT